ncbi:hypothetical protein B0H10DRAFT_2216696 [Mycena sp. CBHHK59/15]|nr:hypothetical protein B0H10DRAFT_2216696 [Mycena sp. CBHHK59/15]
MAPQFPSIPTKHVVRPLLAAPCPVMLPLLLTNIIPEQFPFPQILTDIDASRTPSPPPRPHRAPTPAPRRAPTSAPQSSLTPIQSDDSDSDSDSNSDSDSSHTTKKQLNQIQRPSNTNIQTVKLLFKDLYPDLTEQEHEKEYTVFRTQLDALCTRYLRPSLALTHQDKNDVQKVYKKLTEIFVWLADYNNFWPAAVCLQGKLHNSAARAIDKTTKKVVNVLAGVGPSRSEPKTRTKPKRKATPST